MDVHSHAVFPVVALGGSAGGLQAFTTFLQALDAMDGPPGVAVIVIPHLAPGHESEMPSLLQKETRLPVAALRGETVIEVDHVYVVSPGQTLVADAGRLVTKDLAPGENHHPVDDIFTSLAADLGPRTVAVVLSGTGSNGSAGLAPVHEKGGLVLVQDPQSADFDDMPRHAIATGLVDRVLRPEEMPAAAVRYARAIRRPPGKSREEDRQQEDSRDSGGTQGARGNAASAAKEDRGRPPDLEAILKLIRRQTSVDFDKYKNGTLVRRIERRMRLNNANDLHAYADLLRQNSGELQALADDLLITVTSFFRDPEAWETLRKSVVGRLLEDRAADQPIRAWVAGCASGEEAYSLAILLLEEEARHDNPRPIQIFATDASETALSRARQGVYPAATVRHLTATRREGYFECENGNVRVKADVRERIVFASHNLIQDPPFSHIDLIICRNVLIYLQPEIQDKLLRLFHFALRDDGFLFLGSAETAGRSDHLFETISKKWRLYRRCSGIARQVVDLPGAEAGYAPRTEPAALEERHPVRFREKALKALAERHAPPAVVIDDDYQILYYHGATERFLKPQSGEPSNDLRRLARAGLGVLIRRQVRAAKKSHTPQAERARLRLDGAIAGLVVEVVPLEGMGDSTRLLVSFLEETEAKEAADAGPAGPREQALEAEVNFLRDELDASSGASERAQQELKAYTEEVVSMNEELRAANEELESSKEELHSLNEALNNANRELRLRIEELSQRTDDLDNLLVNSDVASLFLGRDLSIRWLSPGIENLFHVRASDEGRPIADFAKRFEDDAFIADCRAVLRTLSPIEKQVVASDGRWFLRRLVPYRTRDDRIDGVVVTFSDITAVQQARQYAERIVETVPTPLLVLDPSLRVLSANPVFYSTFRTSPEETEERLIYDLGNGQWNIPRLRRLLDDVLPHDHAFHNEEIEHEFEHIGHRWMRLTGRRLDHIQFILLAIEDITSDRRSEMRQRLLMDELSHRVKNTLAVVQGLASQTAAGSDSLEDFSKTFQGRLAALAGAHARILEDDWSSTDIARLVQDAIEPFAPSRVHAHGPAIELAPKKAVALSLVLHELQTNATKYGALSGAEGRVDVSWTLDGQEEVHLVWRESGGPPPAPVSERRRGFGTKFVKQAAAYDLDGKADLAFDNQGLRCELTFPRK